MNGIIAEVLHVVHFEGSEIASSVNWSLPKKKGKQEQGL